MKNKFNDGEYEMIEYYSIRNDEDKEIICFDTLEEAQDYVNTESYESGWEIVKVVM